MLFEYSFFNMSGFKAFKADQLNDLFERKFSVNYRKRKLRIFH